MFKTSAALLSLLMVASCAGNQEPTETPMFGVGEVVGLRRACYTQADLMRAVIDQDRSARCFTMRVPAPCLIILVIEPPVLVLRKPMFVSQCRLPSGDSKNWFLMQPAGTTEPEPEIKGQSA